MLTQGHRGGSLEVKLVGLGGLAGCLGDAERDGAPSSQPWHYCT